MYTENLKKILYITANGAVGGAPVHILELIANLPPEVEVHVVIGEQQEWLMDQLKHYNVKCYHLTALIRAISPAKDLSALWQLVKLIRAIQPDIIHCHTSKAGILGRIAGYLCKVPVVFTAHGWAFTEGVSQHKRLFYGFIERMVARLTKTIITVSDYDRALGVSVMPEQAGKITTIHNGINEFPGVNKKIHRHRHGEELKIAMVARFHEPKDYAQVLQALATLKKENMKFQASLVGDGPLLPAMMNLSRMLDLDDQVQFLGQRNDIAEILSKHNVFVLASSWEGFPLSILEAMRAGLPVVASDVGGVREAVIDNVTGFLIPKGDAQCLADRLRILQHNAELRHSLGLRGRRRFRKYFTAGVMMKNLLNVYDAIVPMTAQTSTRLVQKSS